MIGQLKTKYQRMSLAVDIAQSIGKVKNIDDAQKLAESIVFVLSAPAELLKPHIDHIHRMVNLANGVVKNICRVCHKKVGSTYFATGTGEVEHVYCHHESGSKEKMVLKR